MTGPTCGDCQRGKPYRRMCKAATVAAVSCTAYSMKKMAKEPACKRYKPKTGGKNASLHA